MGDNKKELTIRALHIVLGVVIFIESLLVVLNYQEVAASSHIALPSQFLLVLAALEILGAVLFLIPRTLQIGAYVLLVVFAVAIIIHVLHGQYNVGGLVVYAAAVIAVTYQLQRPVISPA